MKLLKSKAVPTGDREWAVTLSSAQSKLSICIFRANAREHLNQSRGLQRFRLFFPWVGRFDFLGAAVTHLPRVLGGNKPEMECQWCPGGWSELFSLQLLDRSFSICCVTLPLESTRRDSSFKITFLGLDFVSPRWPAMCRWTEVLQLAVGQRRLRRDWWIFPGDGEDSLFLIVGGMLWPGHASLSPACAPVQTYTPLHYSRCGKGDLFARCSVPLCPSSHAGASVGLQALRHHLLHSCSDCCTCWCFVNVFG